MSADRMSGSTLGVSVPVDDPRASLFGRCWNGAASGIRAQRRESIFWRLASRSGSGYVRIRFDDLRRSNMAWDYPSPPPPEVGRKWAWVDGDRRPETGDRRPETGDRRPETGDRRPETGDRRPEFSDRPTPVKKGIPPRTDTFAPVSPLSEGLSLTPVSSRLRLSGGNHMHNSRSESNRRSFGCRSSVRSHGSGRDPLPALAGFRAARASGNR